jgi:hypothetical protein
MATTTEPVASASTASDTEVWHVDGPDLRLTLAPAAVAFLNDLLRDTHESPETLLRKALGLYRLAVDARREGKVIGSAPRADGLDDEFVL